MSKGGRRQAVWVSCVRIRRQKRPHHHVELETLFASTFLGIPSFAHGGAQVFRKLPRVNPLSAGIDWSFMYTRESDRIGTGLPPSDSKLGAAMGRRESLGGRAREKSLGKHPVMYEREEETGVPLRDATCFDLQQRVPEDKETREALLRSFDHARKPENPLYTTSNNSYGMKRPTAATFTFERRARQQGFSNSFNNLKFRDTGLNTNVTRSNIHDSPNPQFI